MFTILFSVMLIAGGFLLFFITGFNPLLKQMLMDYIALFIIMTPTIMLLYLIISKRVTYLLEKVPVNKMLLLFLRRDGTVVPVLGNRAYPGESFIEVPKLGLLHDLGKGSVYRWGTNNIRFALENVNHTPDPRFANFTSWLYDIGFNDIQEVRRTLAHLSNYEEKREEVEERMTTTPDASIEVLVDEIINPPEDKPDEDIITITPVEKPKPTPTVTAHIIKTDYTEEKPREKPKTVAQSIAQSLHNKLKKDIKGEIWK